ncbi:Fms-interacting protein-domain-containing protein [Triangularia verruculosa]|uniref:Fms-interacting protein-domain-containing protein n=1 Tax=Triangularia verruculosa TaxID=2587418 RepID=A0AAN7AXD3_9PEZI|nr:Fms-interacting protein-domain-containing protein [Triangularia verruculosa]
MTVDPQPHVVGVTHPQLVAALETSKAAREQAQGLVKLIADAQTAIANGTGTKADFKLPIQKAKKPFWTNLAVLRGQHRRAHFKARETKALTAEARQEVDSLHLSLQNLRYEERYLELEIAACEGFDHTYQLLPLIPGEEFLAQHPEHADSDENTLMIARINNERAEREALEQQRLELQKQKTKLTTENKKRREDLANLDQQMEKFIDASLSTFHSIFSSQNGSGVSGDK